MIEASILATHAFAALLFVLLALSTVGGDSRAATRIGFCIAFAASALWALSVAGIGEDQLAALLAEGARNVTWVAVLYLLCSSHHRRRAGPALAVVYSVVAGVIVMDCLLVIAADSVGFATDQAASILSLALLLRMMATLAALVLLHAVYEAASPAERVKLVALALLWGGDCLLFAFVYLSGSWTAPAVLLRGVFAVGAGLLFLLSLHRRTGWGVKVSRTFAYQSLSVAAIIAYFIVVAVSTSAIAAIGGNHVRMWQTAFVFGSTAAMLTLTASPWLRAWTRVKLAKHLFRHRYDYRAEWMRFTDTLGRAGGETALENRLVKAIADLVESPAGLLLLPEGEALRRDGSWNWEDEALAEDDAFGTRLARHLATSGRIIEIDRIRQGEDRCDAIAVPEAITDLPNAWVIVPLLHFDQLVGAILLARPPLGRALDWEDFDLLKVAGRQAASYLAEARATAALMEAQRFDEFNRRFAFILHDIKNLVSQMSLMARNAERHGDNPEFRADMVATVKEAANRMTYLIQRLSQRTVRAQTIEPVDIGDIATQVSRVASPDHPVTVSGGEGMLVHADAAALRQILEHLVGNAADASASGEPIDIAVSRHADRVAIDVTDRGCGMSAAFIRDSLFKPFVSTKAGGFGIGAYEARELASAMGGALAVESREGEGTRMRILLCPATGRAEAA